MTTSLEMRPTADLVPYARNARKHSERQIEQIAASIQAYGFNAPVLIDGDSGIIAGHGRVMAAKLLNLEEVPCVSLAHLSPDQKRKYIIADNRLAESSEWDTELLKGELLELFDADQFDELDGIGFSEDEFKSMVGLVDKVPMPELPSGQKSSLEQITFTMHETQMNDVKEALKLMQEQSDFAEVADLNDNRNGNAIHAICLKFLNS